MDINIFVKIQLIIFFKLKVIMVNNILFKMNLKTSVVNFFYI